MRRIVYPKYPSTHSTFPDVPEGISGPDEHPALLAFLTHKEIVKVVMLSFIAAGILAVLYETWNGWVLLGFVGFFLPLLHFCYAGNRAIAFPLFLPVIFGFQHIVSSIYCYNNPMFLLKSDSVFRNESVYFPLAALAGWSMYFGVVLPMRRAKPVVNWHREIFSAYVKKRDFTRILVVTFWLSVLIGLGSGILNSIIPGTAFLWLLLSKASYVSVIALGIIGSKKFGRLLLVLSVLEIRNALQSTIFHPLLFFILLLSSLFVFTSRRRKPLKVLFIIGVIAFSIYSLQCVKEDYRNSTRRGDYSTVDRAEILGNGFVDFLTSPGDIFSKRNLGSSMSRFDQGQIVNMVISFIPDREPYANGGTVIDSLVSAVSLRAISPGKYSAGGSNFFRFTGVPLPEDTSRNLGQLGEFYGNFGSVLGVVACFIYALALGFLWRFFHNRSIDNPIWAAWFPFIALQMVKTEDGLGEVVNYTVKAAIIAFMIIKFVPGWKQLLGIRWRIMGGEKQSAPQGDIPKRDKTAGTWQ